MRRKLHHRYGRARVKGMPGLAAWRTYAGGTYELDYEGRRYTIVPRHRLDERRRAGGWGLSYTPAQHGLHGWIEPDGAEHGNGWRFAFRTPQQAVVAARKFAAKIGPEPYGIMQKWAERSGG